MTGTGESLKAVFINDEEELRSGWRVLAFIACFVIALVVIKSLVASSAVVVPRMRSVLAAPLASERGSPHALTYFGLDSLANLLAAVIATVVCARLLERRSPASVGYKLHPGWFRDFALGSLVGMASLAVAVALATAAGAVTFQRQQISFERAAIELCVLGALLLTAAVFEELFFRGFMFQALVHNIGTFGALAIASVVFGLAHLLNPDATVLSTINTIVAGLWLGAAYLATRSLWLPTGLHFCWNLAMVMIFGLPVSGITTFDGLGWLKGQAGQPEWLSGGGYGPEGGVAATAALIVSILAIRKSGLFRPSEVMLDGARHGRAEPRYLSILRPPRD